MRNISKRIQRKRTKGWRMPANTVYVGRGSKWGNPFHTHGDGRKMDNALAKLAFKSQLEKHSGFIPPGKNGITTIADIKRELKGKNLACWCKEDAPCHGDILLELANK